jgi:hypothetical protein
MLLIELWIGFKNFELRIWFEDLDSENYELW